MPLWEGWSAEPRQVAKTRILSELLSSLSADGRAATISVADAMSRLGIEQDESLRAGLIANDFAETVLFDSEISMAPSRDLLSLTEQGRQAAQEFRTASGRRARTRAARC